MTTETECAHCGSAMPALMPWQDPNLDGNFCSEECLKKKEQYEQEREYLVKDFFIRGGYSCDG